MHCGLISAVCMTQVMTEKENKHIIEGCLIEKKETPDEFSGAIDGQGKEEKTMTKTMKIEGMMCGHCEEACKEST